MTCNDCIHYDVCKALEDQVGMIEARQCGCYKDISRFIELPCKVGAEIFIIIDADNFPSFVDIGTVESFSVHQDGIWIFARYECGLTYWHKLDDLGKGFYLDPYEVEAALKEREVKDDLSVHG